LATNELMDFFHNLSPYIRRAWDGNMPPEWHLMERVIFDYEFIYIMDGEALITIEEMTYRALPGELYIIRPAVRHSIKASAKGMRQPHIHFDLHLLEDREKVPVCYKPLERLKDEEKSWFRDDINQNGLVKFPERVVIKKRAEFEELLFKVIEANEESGLFGALKAKHFFTLLLIHVFEEIDPSWQKKPPVKTINYERMNVIKEFLSSRFNRRMKLEELARIANLSKNHLIREFKATFGVTPIQYQIHVRLEKSKQLMKGSHNSIKEISDFLGFTDIQTFSKTFKKYTGMNPSQYRML
jgi:AraC-like DNA-binding protein